MTHVAPANNPECYSLPCSTDIAAANAINAHTDAVVVAIANATRSGS